MTRVILMPLAPCRGVGKAQAPLCQTMRHFLDEFWTFMFLSPTRTLRPEKVPGSDPPAANCDDKRRQKSSEFVTEIRDMTPSQHTRTRTTRDSTPAPVTRARRRSRMIMHVHGIRTQTSRNAHRHTPQPQPLPSSFPSHIPMPLSSHEGAQTHSIIGSCIERAHAVAEPRATT